MATKDEVELARHLRRNATPAERTAWELLRDRRCAGIKFRRQQAIDEFIVDFYAPRLKLVIEIDGGIHQEPEQVARDELRTAALTDLGLTVIRVQNDGVNAVTLLKVVSAHRNLPLSIRQDGEGVGG